MLLQTNSYIVPKEKRAEHARLMQRFRHALARLGCDHFEVYEQAGAQWSGQDGTGRVVQIMRFRDRKHQTEVQAAEKTDAAAQQLVKEFCELINFPYQQQQSLFAVGYYTSVLANAPSRVPSIPSPHPTATPVVPIFESPATAPPVEAGLSESPAAPEIPSEDAVPTDTPVNGEALAESALNEIVNDQPAPEADLVVGEEPSEQPDHVRNS